MNLETMEVSYFETAGLCTTEDGLHHRKRLPVLSVVQALEGSYNFGLDDALPRPTGPLGVFVAPADRLQDITHRVDPQSGRMRAHWIFLDVTVNGRQRLDDLYDFPQILPAGRNEAVYRWLLQAADRERGLCHRLAGVYALLDILLEEGTPTEIQDGTRNEIKGYIRQHYAEKLTVEEIAKHFSFSVPTLFRRFQCYFGCSPMAYLNEIRLSHAVQLLETTDRPIAEVGETVGLEDPAYFSRLFRRQYGLSPIRYRERERGIREKQQTNLQTANEGRTAE